MAGAKMMRKYYTDVNGEWFVDPILKNHDNLTERKESEYKLFLKNQAMPLIDRLLRQLTWDRKDQERQGVTLNKIRYAGDPGNRQALQESIAIMADAGLTEFAGFKDSDNGFHVDHPVADVVDAYRAIGMRRVALIAAEGEYAAQITAGTLTDLSEVVWP
jgi:hypothetical protein